MRFAVQGLSGIEDFGLWGPDMGEVAQKAAALEGSGRIRNIGLRSQAGVAGIQGNVAAKTGELYKDASKSASNDAMWGSIFQTAGQVAGGAIGSGMFGSGGGGFGSPGNFETGYDFTGGTKYSNIPRYTTNYGF